MGQSSGLFIYLTPEALSDNKAVKMCFLLFYFTLEESSDKAVAMTIKKKRRERERDVWSALFSRRRIAASSRRTARLGGGEGGLWGGSSE